MKKSILKTFLATGVGLGIILVLFGAHYDTALAYSASPDMTVSLSGNYNQSTQTVTLSGATVDGTESFTTYAVCFGNTGEVYNVNGPWGPKSAAWSITNSSGATVLTGLPTLSPVASSYKVFGYVCQGTQRQESLGDYVNRNLAGTIDVSSLAPGTYTATTVIQPACAADYGDANVCSPTPANYTSSFSFTIPGVPTIISVGVTCNPTSIYTSATSACTATVQGTNGYSSAVTWSTNLGTIDQNGNYTAPATPGTATITATSQEDPSKSGSATVVVNARPAATITSVTAICNPASIYTGETSNCTASVQGTNGYSSAVTWSLVSGPGGSINPITGVYTAPAAASGTETVRATSNQDATKSGTATVVVNAQAATIISVGVTCNPTSIYTSATSACTATVQGTNGYSSAVTWSTNLGTIDQNGNYTAPATPGTATITATSQEDPSKSGSATINVNQIPPGTIKVTSENSQINTVQVPAAWYFLPPALTNAVDPCGTDANQGGPCSDVPNATLSNVVPGDPYTIQPLTTYPANLYEQPGGYAFDSIREVPLASNNSQTFLQKLLSFEKNLLPTAEAYNYPPANPPAQPVTSGKTTSFVILWDPIANMSLSQTSLGLNVSSGGGSASAPITVTNTGAPGSNLTWVTNISYPHGSSGWLSIAPTADNSPGLTVPASGGSPSDAITITANSAGLAAGRYTGIVNFAGISSPGSPLSQPTASLTVTFTVNAVCGNGIVEPGEQCDNGTSNGVCPSTCSTSCTINNGGSCPPLPTCSEFVADPTTVIVPNSSNLNYHCINVSACAISGGQFGSGVTASVTGTTASGTAVASPTSDTTYTLSCTGLLSGDSNYNTSLNVNVDIASPGRCEQNPNGVGCPGAQ